jgi:hypothetical protein
MNKNFSIAAFLAGLFAVLWVAFGYRTGHPLALAMSLLIGATYLVGCLELLRFQQATSALQRALGNIPETLNHLGEWLDQLPPALQNPVRLRVEGERTALPGPAITPYLVGLLVMLGMLGTFLGMVVTLNGAVLALESTTDLATIRASLAAPVKGLGLAFGTSVAGVATSAMLGLISALCRRQRQQVGQGLDRHIATTLREYSLVHQRQETFKAIRAQSQALPEVAGQLNAMMETLTRQNREWQERLQAGQEQFHREAQAAYGELARSVDQSLRASLADGARAAGAAIQPVVEATMAGIAKESAALQERTAQTVNTQLAGIASRFDDSTRQVAATWEGALAAQAQHNEALQAQLQQSLAAFAGAFGSQGAALLADLQAAQRTLQGELADQDQQRQAALAAALEASAERIHATAQEQGRQTLEEIARVAALAAAAPQAASQVIAQLQQLQADQTSRDEARQAALGQSLAELAATLRQEWQQAGEQGLAQQRQICQTLEQTALGLTEQTQAQARATLDEIARLMESAAQAPRSAEAVIQQLQTLHTDLTARDEARQAALQQALQDLAANLRAEWQQAGQDTLGQQQAICRTLEETAARMAEQGQAQARDTLQEISRLMATAAEAPRVAAEVIAQLRQQLSQSVAQDNALLEERSRTLETLNTLLATINQAATEQRGAIDALVASAGTMLEQAGNRFNEQVAGETARLADTAASITGGAVEVASLGEAFGAAVAQFGQANGALVANLERIEGSLEKAMLRSDEQLAYYVAQAREIIDLSILSQKQVVDELRQLGATASNAQASA